MMHEARRRGGAWRHRHAQQLPLARALTVRGSSHYMDSGVLAGDEHLEKRHFGGHHSVSCAMAHRHWCLVVRGCSALMKKMSAPHHMPFERSS